MIKNLCPVCNSSMNSTLESWHWVCSNCEYEQADFAPAINETLVHEKIDERFREKGLRSLRIDNFNKLLQSITKTSSHSSLLDVGCAHGWFLDAAQQRGFQVLGIEPDINVFKVATQRGLPIRQGFFPDVLDANEKFDVIVFNDVFEHIPDVVAVLNGCSKHLKPEGILVLNLPSSSGLFYKLARVLHKLGINSFFDRLWQKGYPSPHLHYFNPNNLQLLLQSNGFEEVTKGRLATLRLQGLFARISHTGMHSRLMSAAICTLAIFAVPVLWVMPSDIVYAIFKKSK